MLALAFILLSVICSLLIAHFLKLLESRKLNTLRVLTINYFAAVIVALFINQLSGVYFLPDFPFWLWIFAFFIGVVFIANFFIFSKSTHLNGVGITLTAMRLSLFLPVMVSVLMFNEVITLLRGIGIFLVFAALGILIVSRSDVKSDIISNKWILGGVFFFTGIGDASLKIFERMGLSEGTAVHFMSIVFFSSFICGLLSVLFKSNIKFIKEEMRLGVLIGISNLLTTIFLIMALSHADGVVVYPAVNILIITGGAVIGKLFWDDKISPLEAGGMVLAILAIMLLL